MVDRVSTNSYPSCSPSVRLLSELVRISPLLLVLAALVPVLPAGTASSAPIARSNLEVEVDTILRRDLSVPPAAVPLGLGRCCG